MRQWTPVLIGMGFALISAVAIAAAALSYVVHLDSLRPQPELHRFVNP